MANRVVLNETSYFGWGARDVLASEIEKRKYKKALSNDEIISELKENAGTQFDPRIVPIMIDMLNDGFTDDVRKEYGPGSTKD